MNKTIIQEREERKKIYEETFKLVATLNEKEDLEKEDSSHISKITEIEEIKELLKEYKRDNHYFSIFDKEDNEYKENKILKITEDAILVSNPFSNYLNKIFPKKIKCVFDINGHEHAFTLDKINDKDNGQFVFCELPKFINKYKDSDENRVVPENNEFSVGLFLLDKNTEIIGSISYISHKNIGIKLLESSIDNEILSYISKNKTKIIFPCIIDFNNTYIPFNVKCINISHDNSSKTIHIDMSIITKGINDDLKVVDDFFEYIDKRYIDKIKDNKTENLIRSSKMGIKL